MFLPLGFWATVRLVSLLPCSLCCWHLHLPNSIGLMLRAHLSAIHQHWSLEEISTSMMISNTTHLLGTSKCVSSAPISPLGTIIIHFTAYATSSGYLKAFSPSTCPKQFLVSSILQTCIFPALPHHTNRPGTKDQNKTEQWTRNSPFLSFLVLPLKSLSKTHQPCIQMGPRLHFPHSRAVVLSQAMAFLLSLLNLWFPSCSPGLLHTSPSSLWKYT